MATDPFLQSDGATLKNILGIEDDPEALAHTERELSARRMVKADSVSGNFDQQHLRDIHQHIFQDVYEWAGTMRSDTIQLEERIVYVPAFAGLLSKGGTAFLPSSYLGQGLSDVERKANSDEARSPKPEVFAEAATEVLSDLNYVHPFREGNGRTQRVFIQQLAERAGHSLSFQGVTERRNIEASIEAHSGKAEELFRIIRESLDPRRVALRAEAFAALRSDGEAMQDAWIETPEIGDQIKGVVATRDESHASIMDAQRRYVAVEATALPPALLPGHTVDFIYGTARMDGTAPEDVAADTSHALIERLSADLAASRRPTDPEYREALAEAVTDALSGSERASLEAGELSVLAALTSDPAVQNALAFEYLRQEVGNGRTDLVEAMQAANLATQAALPEADTSQKLGKQSL